MEFYTPWAPRVSVLSQYVNLGSSNNASWAGLRCNSPMGIWGSSEILTIFSPPLDEVDLRSSALGPRLGLSDPNAQRCSGAPGGHGFHGAPPQAHAREVTERSAQSIQEAEAEAPGAGGFETTSARAPSS